MASDRGFKRFLKAQLGILGIVGVISAQAAPVPQVDEPKETEVWALLTGTRSPALGVEAMAARVFELGPGHSRAVLEILLRDTRKVPVETPELKLRAQALQTYRSALILCLSSLESKDLEPLLESTLDADPHADRAVALLGLLRDLGKSTALPLIVKCTLRIGQVESQSPTVQSLLRQTTAGVLQRDTQSIHRLPRLVEALPGRTCLGIISGIADSTHPDSAAILVSLLGRNADIDVAVLRHLQSLAQRDIVFGAEMLESIRTLLTDRLGNRRRHAAAVLGVLRDARSAPKLIALLGDDDRLCQHAAWSALQQISGARLPIDKDAWNSWLETEEAWRNGPGASVVAVLQGTNAAELAKAISEAQKHPLYREEYVVALAKWLKTEWVEAQNLARGALVALGGPDARRAVRQKSEPKEPGTK